MLGLIYQQFLGLCAIFVYLKRAGGFVTSLSFLCPDWCDCVVTKEMKEGDIRLSCGWPSIPDIERLRFLLPIENNIVRLNIKCKNSSQNGQFLPKNLSKLHAGLFSHLHKLRHLKIADCPLDGNILPNGFSNGLHGLRSLHLSKLNDPDSANTFSIEPGALENFQNLETLTVTNSKIDQFLPNTDVCRMSELKTLNLSENLLKRLDDLDCSIEQRNQLIILDLSHNKIAKMDDYSFRTFQSLRILHLNHNQLRVIPPGLFAFNQQLKDLVLSSNKLSKIEDLPANLQGLNLRGNNLRFLPPSLAHHQSVKTLDLSHNHIDFEAPFSFESNPQLEVLDLKHNDIRIIGENLFGPNTNGIIKLDLGDNSLHTVEQNSLKNLMNLKQLRLANNKMSVLRRGSLNGLTRLTYLDLENCSLHHADDNAFVDLKSLNEIRLFNNHLKLLPQGITLLKNLQILNASGNSIASITNFSFAEMEQLRVIDFSRNKLSNIDRTTFGKIDKLEYLDLSTNRIQQLEPNALDGANNLVRLNIGNNQISDINGVFANLNRLRFLSVSKNKLAHIDLALLPPNLNKLDASDNVINQITMFFAGMAGRMFENLTEIDLSGNKLERLTTDMLPQSVRSINLARNRLQKIDDNIFSENRNLMGLDLSHNHLQTMNEITNTNRSAFSIDLSHNPLICDCNLEWIISRQKNLIQSPYPAESDEIGYSIDNIDRLHCRTVKNSKFRFLKEIDRDEFLCSYAVRCSKGCLCCDFESCDCKNICPYNCSCLADKHLNINEVTCSGAWKIENDQGDRLNHENRLRTVPMHATVIRLDGLNFPKLGRNAFFGRYRLKKLYLNNSQLIECAFKTFSGLTSLDTLDLSDNKLVEIIGEEFYSMPKLEILFLHNNLLRHLGPGTFKNLPSLKLITLHGNRLEILPAVFRQIQAMPATTLGQNPWKCDCNYSRYQFPSWLVAHSNAVLDNREVYCYENLTDQSNNSATVLALLPPTNGADIVKVNVWTFTNEINRTFCTASTASSVNKDVDSSKGGPLWFGMESNTLFLSLAISTVLALAVLMLIMWRLKCKLSAASRSRAKYSGGDCGRRSSSGINYDNNDAKHSASGHLFASMLRGDRLRREPAADSGGGTLSVRNCHSNQHSPSGTVPTSEIDCSCGASTGGTCTTNTANPTPTIPMPVMKYDAFLSYSSADESFVLECIAPRLERDNGYKLCLLYREFARNISMDRQHVDNELIDAMEKSRRVLTVYSKNFVDNEWEQVRIRTAYQWLAHCQCRKSIIVVLDDTPPVDHALAKYMRMNLRYRYQENMFWDNLLAAMPMPHYHYHLDVEKNASPAGHHFCADYLETSDPDTSAYDSIKDREDGYSVKYGEKVRYQTDLFGKTTIVPSLMV